MGMNKAARQILGFGLLACCWGLGCQTVGQNGDPLLEAILKPPTEGARAGQSHLSPAEVVLLEVPLKTPMPEARAAMEKHGFTCWSGMVTDKGTYLHCTAFKRTALNRADRVLVKLFYRERRVVEVEVGIDKDVFQPFSTPMPKTKPAK
jgi:hypothetical protein